MAAMALVLAPLWSYAEGERANKVITIDCDANGVKSVDPNPLRIVKGESVDFQIVVGGGCAAVSVNGPAPIGAFALTQASPSQTKGPFNEIGRIQYTVTKTARADPYEAEIHVTGRVPSLTTYGIIVLVLLLLISTVWVIRKKRARVPA